MSKKVLLTSVFGPYAQDDKYGSRSINPMELFHNQVTRVQGIFSLRMFHRSWGLNFIKENIDAPCVILDFPKLKRFVREIKKNSYDIIGISSIYVNLRKVKIMCRLVRKFSPKSTIVVGGHIANTPGIEKIIDADRIVKGEGIKWFREFLGEDTSKPIKHPAMFAEISPKIMGIPLFQRSKSNFAVLIPAVGCPMGCNFCSTSHMFGGKGKFVDFFPKAKSLYETIDSIASRLKTNRFFVMDENFLLNKTKTLKLLDMMKKNNKNWIFYIFSSANALKQYDIQTLLELGISFIWIGLEGEDSGYEKLASTDTYELVDNLRANGIHVLGSTIIGMDHQDSRDVKKTINNAVKYNTDFHQFMLYMPLPGTPLYNDFMGKDLLFNAKNFDLADAHGQYKFNYKHPLIESGKENNLLLEAFKMDFIKNGPSVIRFFETLLNGWEKYSNSENKRIQAIIKDRADIFIHILPGLIKSVQTYYRKNLKTEWPLGNIQKRAWSHASPLDKLIAPLIGAWIKIMMVLETRRILKGLAPEPPTFYER
ncbi:MAG: radical SAM protein [Candidatus Omnitrophica bacterium]|nr:radical SAM protein [Candidatus Omnitrophota bacterium]